MAKERIFHLWKHLENSRKLNFYTQSILLKIEKHFGVSELYDTFLEGNTLNNINWLHPYFDNGQTVFQRGEIIWLLSHSFLCLTPNYDLSSASYCLHRAQRTVFFSPYIFLGASQHALLMTVTIVHCQGNKSRDNCVTYFGITCVAK